MKGHMTVAYKPTFVRQYQKLPKELQEDVRRAILLFSKDSGDHSLHTHKLKGRLRGFFSFSVNYKYRIVFAYEGKRTAVLHAVGDHDVYA